MTQWGKALATNPEYLSLISRTYMVKGERKLPFDFHMCMWYVYMCVSKHMNAHAI